MKLSISVLTDASPQQPSLVVTIDHLQIEPPRSFQPAELIWLGQYAWNSVFPGSLLEHGYRMGPGGQLGRS